MGLSNVVKSSKRILFSKQLDPIYKGGPLFHWSPLCQKMKPKARTLIEKQFPGQECADTSTYRCFS